MRNTSPVLKTNVEILRQASKIYSPKVFKMFEDEYVKAWDCTIEKISKAGTKVEYKVIYAGRGTKHHVRFEPSPTIVECSCKKFSFVGILCAHALKVLEQVDFAIAGVKTKATVGRPKGRIKGALEKRKCHKVQHKSKASELFFL
ncbi:Protein FAR1-RELATED SEQUENCE 5 [Linum perenne]